MKQNDNDTLPDPESYGGTDVYLYVTGTDRIKSITGNQNLTYTYDACI